MNLDLLNRRGIAACQAIVLEGIPAFCEQAQTIERALGRASIYRVLHQDIESPRKIRAPMKEV
jgi:uncharacterized iron-regulated protein